ncbi:MULTISPECIES: NUDIX domain-containing protein [Pseudonocardia]|uniref:RNA pyrophosphohydrolase n=3 Tax=Pseudonocardia TaxID=1847 RepID=A0A1L8QA66_PSEAH|nr:MULTISPECIES: NUDIX hydrolase [Pseudonocardia]OJG04390.1 RNA pyrophosphohydrolase [Pseudonocardia autotrophica]OSY35705.1 RNA pyrophosphohydrolase [Pseudonocardia autotrophica]TDN75685.1 ADP-ribose pyrophosphatase YjhB (NUDIX family) [Pseudonocardia autotrophica]BBF99657.1 NUDIX hydrolase [Pseudonocardia autotrophica]GEC28824.1 NUDIX hydrolase [Pseudonocardia saturnea]
MSDPSETFATPRVAAGALFLDNSSRILLVHPTYKDTWDIPGGYVERGESPAAACRREIAEELGLDRNPAALLSVDWAPSEKEGDKLLFIFDCGQIGEDTKRIQLAEDELDRWAWVALGDLDSYVIPRLARRLRSTAEGGPRYLEHGGALNSAY